MESTKKNSQAVVWIIIAIVIIIAIWLVMRTKAGTPEYPTTVSDQSLNKSDLEASASDTVNFDDEASLKQMDQEFQ